MDSKRTTTAVAAALAVVALTVGAPAARADDTTGTPAPTPTETAGTAGTSSTTATAPSTPTTTPSTSTPADTTTPTTTPPASPVVLRSGQTGWAVRDLQSRLAVLGRSSGAIDGVFDAAVASALAGFLTRNGLPGDGTALTQAALDLLVRQTASALVAHPGTYTAVARDAQVRLRTVRSTYWPYAFSTSYGATLAARLLTFQRDQNLPQSGALDTRTWARLVALTATPTLMKLGQTGFTVNDAQSRLKLVKAAYWPHAYSRYFDAALRAALLTFQRDQALPQSGVIDTRTWGRLVKLTATPVVLRPITPAANIRELQRRLSAKGLWPYSFSGTYGATLSKQVLTFQRVQNLPQSGVVDSRTWARLRAVTYVPGTFDKHRFYAGLRPVMPTAASLDSRCRTGRVMCVDKATRTLTWVVDGKPLMVMWARFGRPGLETREGTFRVSRKYEYVISNLYFTPMPYSMFFSGGQAVHYSSNFARLGYASASHGCVNIADMVQIKSLFFKVRVGDKVVVHH